jgi:probable F420-dependent oxidoreductase
MTERDADTSHARAVDLSDPAIRSRLGVELPAFGPNTSASAISSVAVQAERLGFGSVWTFERLLLPEENSYGMPVDLAWAYDPIETLAWVAAHTTTIRLGTCVIDALFHPPVVLAKRLATLHKLSGGRVVAGVGQGWMPEEFLVTGTSAVQRGPRFEEHLAVMRACWGADSVSYAGDHYQVPSARVGPKPSTSLPILIGGVARVAVERAARLGDGYVQALRDWEELGTQIAWYRQAGGTGPVIVRIAGETPDIARLFTAGADEIIWDLTWDTDGRLSHLGPEAMVAVLEQAAG